MFGKLTFTKSHIYVDKNCFFKEKSKKNLKCNKIERMEQYSYEI